MFVSVGRQCGGHVEAERLQRLAVARRDDVGDSWHKEKVGHTFRDIKPNRAATTAAMPSKEKEAGHQTDHQQTW